MLLEYFPEFCLNFRCSVLFPPIFPNGYLFVSENPYIRWIFPENPAISHTIDVLDIFTVPTFTININQTYLFRRYLDPKNMPKIHSQKGLGALGKFR